MHTGQRRAAALASDGVELVKGDSADTALMLEWFDRVGYDVDITGLEREFGRSLTKLPDWARRHAAWKAP